MVLGVAVAVWGCGAPELGGIFLRNVTGWAAAHLFYLYEHLLEQIRVRRGQHGFGNLCCRIGGPDRQLGWK